MTPKGGHGLPIEWSRLPAGAYCGASPAAQATSSLNPSPADETSVFIEAWPTPPLGTTGST